MPSLTIPVSHGQLEAHLDHPNGDPKATAIVCHPHPQHGGTMHNKVVYHTAKALAESGAVVLRFNFRGVGQSTGEYDDGVGEREDAKVAVDWLTNENPDLPIILSGFSFGSMVALSLIDDIENVQSAVGIGLPLSLYHLSYLTDVEIPTLIVQGDNDEFATFEEIQAMFDGTNRNLTLREIEDADHFLTERYDRLRAIIQTYYATGDGATVFGTESTEHGRGIP